VVDGNQNFQVSKISDRLFCLCKQELIPIPPFISEIGSCFHSIDSYVQTLEIPASIEEIGDFLQVNSLTIVRFCSGSKLREIHGFYDCKSLQRIEFPASGEIIEGLNQCRSLKEVVFENESRVRIIRAFCFCISLCEIETPSSTEIIEGFDNCKLLVKCAFAANSRVRKIQGFRCCCSLCEIEIPAMVETIKGFQRCDKLNKILFASESNVKVIEGFMFCSSPRRIEIPASTMKITGFGFSGLRELRFAEEMTVEDIRTTEKDKSGFFIEFEESELKYRRRQFHLGWQKPFVRMICF
jgi:hypothetical protein